MIECLWRPSEAPCDSCGTTERQRLVLTVKLTNKKSELGYGLPDLILCQQCQQEFHEGTQP